MRVLVAGGEGFIGRYIVVALRAAGHEVVSGARRPVGGSSIPCDFSRDLDPGVWASRLQGFDVVVNAVGILRESGANTFERIHVSGPKALFEGCVLAGVRRVVHISALGSVEVGEYLASKYRGDGSAARGDPLYEAMVQVGKLLRTVFLCDYFVNEAFRRELLRVLNRGEAVNALKRAIYVGRVASYQAKQHEEMQAVADALSLLANLGDGLEYDENAVGARPLERPTFHRGAAGADRTHRPDTHRGHQLAGRVHLPDRAIPGPATTVTSGSEITRFWWLSGSSKP